MQKKFRIKPTSKLYGFSGVWHAKKPQLQNKLKKKYSNFLLGVKCKNLTILLGMDSFKLKDKVADQQSSGWIKRIAWITQFLQCGRIFCFVWHHIIELKRILLCLGLLYEQCQSPDVLISVFYIPATPKRIKMVLPTIKYIFIHNIRRLHVLREFSPPTKYHVSLFKLNFFLD